MTKIYMKLLFHRSALAVGIICCVCRKNYTEYQCGKCRVVERRYQRYQNSCTGNLGITSEERINRPMTRKWKIDISKGKSHHARHRPIWEWRRLHFLSFPLWLQEGWMQRQTGISLKLLRQHVDITYIKTGDYQKGLAETDRCKSAVHLTFNM